MEIELGALKIRMNKIGILTSRILSNTRARETFWVALLYVLLARISQCFAIDPGNVTPIWIPSGVMLALILYKGSNIWPGIFLGAFLGNIWAYLSFESIYSVTFALSAAGLNGLGDTLGIAGAAYLLKKKLPDRQPVTSLRNLFWFISIAAVAGPLVSALFGVGGLFVFSFLESPQLLTVFLTWFVGGSTGALIYTPVILAWLYPINKDTQCSRPLSIGCIIYTLTITSLSFDLFQINQYVFYTLLMGLPALFYLIFSYSQRLTFSIQFCVVSIAVLATAFDMGPFSNSDANTSLIKLQLFSSIFSLVIYVLAIFSLEKAQIKASLERRKNELEKLYRLDALTQLWNRYRIQENLEIELSRFRREKRPFGIALIDIDDFKHVNDDFGHLEGDKVLVDISTLIKNQIRESDLLGRWGGEEFIIIVSDTTIQSLNIFAEKIRLSVSEHQFSVPRKITVSIGLSVSHINDTELLILDRADEALYKAKKMDKDCVQSMETEDIENDNRPLKKKPVSRIR